MEDATAPYYRTLAVNCNGTDGTWNAMDGTGSTEESGSMIEGDTTIVEPTCPTSTAPCDPLTLTHMDQAGFNLICDNPLEAGSVLQDGNSCILLCDNHLTMSISCGLSDEGDKTWLADDGTVLVDEKGVDKVQCYEDIQ